METPVHRGALSILLLASLLVAGSASRDITDIAGIISDIKGATKLPDAQDFEVAYQQYAELLAPVMLLSNGLNFEVRTRIPSNPCPLEIPCLTCQCQPFLVCSRSPHISVFKFGHCRRGL